MGFTSLKMSHRSGFTLLLCSSFLVACGDSESPESSMNIFVPEAVELASNDTQNVNIQARSEGTLFSVEDTGTNLAISIDYTDIASAANTQIFLNTDNDLTTGFSFIGEAWGAIGADYMIQNQHLYQSLSNSNEWNWQPIGELTAYIRTNNQIEIAIDKGLLNDPCGTIQAGVMGRNETWGVEAMYPVATELLQVSISACLEDIVRPVVTLNGDTEITVIQGDVFNDPGATAIDETDGDISSFIETSGTVNTLVLGSYPIAYIARDLSNNVGVSPLRTITVIAPDTPLPPVTINGNWELLVNKQILEVGTHPYTGFTAAQDPNTNDIYLRFIEGFANAVGHVQIYLDTDNDPATGYQVWNSASEVALTGAEYLIENGRMTRYIGTGSNWSWSEEATDTPFLHQFTEGVGTRASNKLIKSILPSSIVTGDKVGITMIGVLANWSRYTILANHDVYTIERPVDSIAPSIMLIGADVVTHTLGTPYEELGATAIDEVDGDLSGLVVASGEVDTTVVGRYTITYEVSDLAMNTTTMTRTVNVIAPLVAE